MLTLLVFFLYIALYSLALYVVAVPVLFLVYRHTGGNLSFSRWWISWSRQR